MENGDEIGGRSGGISGAFFNTGGNAGGTLAPVYEALLGAAHLQVAGVSSSWQCCSA